MSAWGLGNIGSGVGSVYGIIVVNYPSGSTVTIKYRPGTSGSYSNYNCKKEDLSSTRRVYYVKDEGYYYITSTKGSSSNSTTVQISVTSRAANITLNYEYWIIKNGAIQNSLGNFTKKGMKMTDQSTAIAFVPVVNYNSGNIEVYGGGDGTSFTQGIAYIPTKISFANKATLHIEGQIKNGTGTQSYLGVDAWNSFGTYQSENIIFQHQMVTTSTSYVNYSYNIGVSAYSGSYYVGINVARKNSNSSGIKITNMYLL